MTLKLRENVLLGQRGKSLAKNCTRRSRFSDFRRSEELLDLRYFLNCKDSGGFLDYINRVVFLTFEELVDFKRTLENFKNV